MSYSETYCCPICRTVLKMFRGGPSPDMNESDYEKASQANEQRRNAFQKQAASCECGWKGTFKEAWAA